MTGVQTCALPISTLFSALAASGGGAPAYADACQPDDPCAAAQSGQIAPLSRFLGTIRQATGGGTPVGSQLCQSGGQLVYQIQVIVGGRQMTLRINAVTGAPMN